MLMKNKFLIFMPSLMMGTILTISSSSWASAWMGLEINLMSMAPILINKMSYSSMEATIKYFLVQAIASTLLIFSIFMFMNDHIFNLESNLNSFMLTFLVLKSGIAPFHFWFPQVMSCSSWIQCLIILTWQKIAPFTLMSFLKFSSLMWIFIICSASIGTLGAINQIDMKKILTYSSINHSAWMLSLIQHHEMMWWIYLVSYFFLTFAISFIFLINNINKLSSINLVNHPPLTKIIFLVNFLSIAGMPPFLGFFIKLMSIQCFMEFNFSILLMSSLIFSSAISFYFYLRILFTSLFIQTGWSNNPQMSINKISLTPMFLFNSLSLMGNFTFPLMILLT